MACQNRFTTLFVTEPRNYDDHMSELIYNGVRISARTPPFLLKCQGIIDLGALAETLILEHPIPPEVLDLIPGPYREIAQVLATPLPDGEQRTDDYELR